jgi:gliding motility-associated lipoprotein GldH
MLIRWILILSVSFFFSACSESGLYEKVDFMPDHAWSYANQPEFSFAVKDTTANYQVYFIIRHADAYEYNNIWIKLKSKLPGESVEREDRFDVPLATDNKWLGSGMDDLHDHRVLLYREPVRFSKTGLYTIKIAHDMRVEPLQYVFNVGLRVEKVN